MTTTRFSRAVLVASDVRSPRQFRSELKGAGLTSPHLRRGGLVPPPPGRLLLRPLVRGARAYGSDSRLRRLPGELHQTDGGPDFTLSEKKGRR